MNRLDRRALSNRRLKRKLTDTAQIKSQRRQPIVRNKSLECVVDTNHAHVVGHGQARVLERGDNAQRHLVICRKHGSRRLRPAGKHLGRGGEQGGLAGGILGGISTGQPVVCRFAVKPTSSILTPRRSVNTAGEAVEVVTKGRHDPCVGIRAVPVGEAMMACVLLDHLLLDRGQTGGQRGTIG